MVAAEIYKALGDPIRLEIVKRLAKRPAYTIGELSANLGVSRQGARKQLQVLVKANIARLAQEGRETQVTLDPDALRTARSFISQLERQWEQRLEALKTFAEE